MMAVRPYTIPVETVIDVEDETMSDLESMFADNNKKEL